jgi:hypothetical protein
MTPELWQRLKPLFNAALEEDTQNRAAFINTACGRDLELKRHLEQLLEAEQQATRSLDAPPAQLNGFLGNSGGRFHATVTKDFPQEVAIYQKILTHLPPPRNPQATSI